jgi:hypothetical protein
VLAITKQLPLDNDQKVLQSAIKEQHCNKIHQLKKLHKLFFGMLILIIQIKKKDVWVDVQEIVIFFEFILKLMRNED